jgi:ATP-dependent Lon protease
MSSTDSEYNKLKELIEISVNIPFTNIIRQPINNISQYLITIKNKLDAELYGMNRIKEELLMVINQRLNNLNSTETSIALVGPSGVGKTKIISLLADILNYEFVHISLGGVNDSSFLAGHLYTYEGAKPGKIVDSLIQMKTNDGILFFDEIDKISSTSAGKEVSNQLLHITDFTQNNHFIDRYLSDIPIDLSKIWFIFSLNSISDIDPILSNRLNYIYVDDYTIEDKINICKLHLIPKAFIKYKLDNTKYIFDTNAIIKIINHNINVSGIRELKRSIDKIFSKLSLLENSQLLISHLSFKIEFKKTHNKITNTIIDKLLS